MNTNTNTLTRYLRRLPRDNKGSLILHHLKERLKSIARMSLDELEDQVLIIEQSLSPALDNNPQSALEWMLYTYPSVQFFEKEQSLYQQAGKNEPELSLEKIKLLTRLDQVVESLSLGNVDLDLPMKNPDIKKLIHIGDLSLLSIGVSSGRMHFLDHLNPSSSFKNLTTSSHFAAFYNKLPQAIDIHQWIGAKHAALQQEIEPKIWDSLDISYLIQPNVDVPQFSPPEVWWTKMINSNHSQKWVVIEKVLEAHPQSQDIFTEKMLENFAPASTPSPLLKKSLALYTQNPDHPNPLTVRFRAIDKNLAKLNFYNFNPEKIQQYFLALFHHLPLHVRQQEESQELERLSALLIKPTSSVSFEETDPVFAQRKKWADSLRVRYQGDDEKAPSAGMSQLIYWMTQPLKKPDDHYTVGDLEISNLSWARNVGQWLASHQNHPDFFQACQALEGCVGKMPDMMPKPHYVDFHRNDLELEVRLWQLCANRQLRRAELKDRRFGGLETQHQRILKAITKLIEQDARPQWGVETGRAYYELTQSDHRLAEPLHVFLQQQCLQAETPDVQKSKSPTRRL